MPLVKGVCRTTGIYYCHARCVRLCDVLTTWITYMDYEFVRKS